MSGWNIKRIPEKKGRQEYPGGASGIAASAADDGRYRGTCCNNGVNRSCAGTFRKGEL